MLPVCWSFLFFRHSVSVCLRCIRCLRWPAFVVLVRFVFIWFVLGLCCVGVGVACAAWSVQWCASSMAARQPHHRQLARPWESACRRKAARREQCDFFHVRCTTLNLDGDNKKKSSVTARHIRCWCATKWIFFWHPGYQRSQHVTPWQRYLRHETHAVKHGENTSTLELRTVAHTVTLQATTDSDNENDNDNDTLRQGQPTSVSGLALRTWVKGSSSRKKESGETVVPCALGKVCHWDTVADSVQSRKEKNEEDTGSCWDKFKWLRATRESSDSGNQGQRQPWTKGRKSVAGSCAHHSSLRRNVGLARVASYSGQDPCVRSFWIIFVGWQSLAKFFTTSCRWQSFTKFRIVVALHHQQECSQHLREGMRHKALANFFASISRGVWKLSGIFPDCIVSAPGAIRNPPCSFCAGVLCREVLLTRLRTCFPLCSNIIDLLLSWSIHFNVVYLTFGSLFLDMIKDAGDVAPYQQKATPNQIWNVCDWDTTERHQPSDAQLSLPTCTQRESGKPTFRLWPKTLERRCSLLSSSHCLPETNLKEKDYPLNSEGQVIRFLLLLAKNRTRSEAEPDAPPLDVMQLLAQHVQGYMEAQGHLCHLPVLQEMGNYVARSMQPDDKQRALTHVVFTRAVCLLVFRRLTCSSSVLSGLRKSLISSSNLFFGLPTAL